MGDTSQNTTNNIWLVTWLSQTNQTKWHFTPRYPFQVFSSKELSSQPQFHRRHHLWAYYLSHHHHLKINNEIVIEADYFNINSTDEIRNSTINRTYTIERPSPEITFKICTNKMYKIKFDWTYTDLTWIVVKRYSTL